MIKHLSFHLCFALIVGLILGPYLSFSYTQIQWLLGIGLSFIFLVYFIVNNFINPRFYFALAGFIAMVIIGIGRSGLAKENLSKNHYTHYIAKENTLILSVKNILKASKNYNKYEVFVHQINSKKANGKLLLNIKKDSLNNRLKIGQFLFTNAKIIAINKPKNPFQFNYKKYLENQNIYAQIYTDFKAVKILKKRKVSIYSLAGDFRKKVVATLISKGLKGEELAVVKALLLGERNQISATLRESYVAAGAVHILAISGLHIGIIMMLIGFVLKPLETFKNGKKIKLILIILSLWIYAIIAGLSPSVIRATTMFTAVSIALFSNRKTDIYNVLALSAFFLLLFNPSYLFNVGFQMSYFAVIAIVALQPKLASLWRPKQKIVTYFWQLFCVSTAAQIGVLPLSLFYFHQFPGLFFLTNMVVIPLLGFILGYGLLIILLASVNILPHFLVEYYQYIIHYLNVFITWVSHQESFLFKNISFSFTLMLLCYLAILSIYYWRTRKTITSIYLTCFAILSLQIVLFYESYTATNSHKFIVFDNYKDPFIAIKRGRGLQLLSKNSNDYILKSYCVGAHIEKVTFFKTQQNIFMINGQKVLIIDANGVFEPLDNVDTVILTKSPKINLQRLIEKLNPQLIIVDNTNYKSFVARWQQTCTQLNIPFYNVSKKGAFIYSF
ncbi:MAG: competence protein ComEC family protein [Flavobacteriaceae bacterium]|nr:competence protein ComEC family protein [Flavobacteriaceae bacterium]